MQAAVVYICAVHIPSEANSKLLLAQLRDNINKSLFANPDIVFIAGDLNQADLNPAQLEVIKHYIRCILILLRSTKHSRNPGSGLPDHLSLFLYPHYYK